MHLHPTYDRLLLLDRIESTYAFADRTLEAVTEGRQTEPGVCGLWSVKDVIAHLTHWEQRTVRWVDEAAQGVKLIAPETGYGWDEADLNRLNDFYQQRDQAKAWDDVLADWHSAQTDILTLVEDLNDDDLAGEGRFAGLFLDSPADAIAGNTFLHYEIHIAQIRQWLHT
jgi:hypothetical protein